tara:strand:- start:383 stop:517 length:135 start_codon:yes stop_codon:yes gene_type:complete
MDKRNMKYAFKMSAVYVLVGSLLAVVFVAVSLMVVASRAMKGGS